MVQVEEFDGEVFIDGEPVFPHEYGERSYLCGQGRVYRTDTRRNGQTRVIEIKNDKKRLEILPDLAFEEGARRVIGQWAAVERGGRP